jgi:integrase/recombinase XerD
MNNEKNNSELIGDLVRIRQRGRTWYANYQFDGRQCRKSLRTHSKKEARRRALVLEAELIEGRHRPDIQPPPIAAVVAAYLSHSTTEGRAKKTLTKYRAVLNRIVELAGRLGRTTLAELDLVMIDRYRRERVEAEIAPKTLYNESTILRQLVNFALSRGMIRDDPLKGIRIREPKPTPQPCWSPAEVEQILAAADGPYHAALVLLADTGMRVGELCHLTWDDVDPDSNVVMVRAKGDWRPKTGDERAIPMTPRVCQLLQRLPRDGEWVVTAPASRHNAEPGRQTSDRRLLVSLKRLLAELDLPGHLHTFRHSFISKAIAAGVPEAVVRQWVGHVDQDILKRYIHIADAESQAAMRRLSEPQDSSVNRPEKDDDDNESDDDSAQI